MSRPVPLMFVSGPPVYIAVPFLDEESTSVFVKDEDESTLLVEDNPVKIKEIDPRIVAKMRRIRTSFGQQIYRPLTFYLDDDEEIKGNVAKYEDNTIVIEINGDEDTIVSIELSDIQDITWRGKPLPGN